MERTIVGIFDSDQEVQPLIQDLSGLGVSRSHIEIINNVSEFDEVEGDDPAIARKTSGLRRWLEDLGLVGKEPDYMAESIRRGSVLVKVHADEAQVDRAAALICQHGAIDIEDRGREYSAAGFTDFDEQAPRFTNEEMLAERERHRASGLPSELLKDDKRRYRVVNAANRVRTREADFSAAPRRELEAKVDSTIRTSMGTELG